MQIQQNGTLTGKRYINLVRCSTNEQAETSIPAQLELLNGYAKQCGMIHAGGDDIVLDGVSGSKPGNRDDFQQIIHRKRAHDDFDVLLVQTEDRLTRAGADHGIWMKHEFERNGIEIIYASSDVPEGQYETIMRSLKFQAAQETVKNTSLRSTQGYQRALENRNVATCTHSPYGTHRLYCTSDDRPLFILRDNGDGTQDKLHPETRVVLETYGAVGGGSRGHYRKQKSEKVYLVTGDERDMAVIRRMFQRRYIDGVGGRRIANELNDDGILAPHGGRWTQRQVEVVTENDVYTGTSIANRVASGRFYQRAKGSPQKVQLNAKIIATKKTIPLRLRPPEDWIYQEQSHLKNYLPEPLRTIAAERINQIWTERCRAGRQKRQLNPHPDSDYLLTNILVCKQDGRKLKGYTSGPKGRRIRYYVHSLAQKDSIAAGLPNTTFRADALESAVLIILQDIFQNHASLETEVRAAVQTASTAAEAPNDTTIAKLKEQKLALSKKIMMVLDVIEGDAPEAKAKIAELQRRQREIDSQIKQLATIASAVQFDVEQVVQSVLERLRKLGEELTTIPTFQLRQVLGTLIDSMVADMHTREVRLTLKIPEAAFSDRKTPLNVLSLQQNSASSTDSQTQQRVVANILCRFERRQQSPCYECRREAA